MILVFFLILPAMFPQRRNPIPPVMMRSAIVISTTGSSFQGIMLVEKRSKPALLKAETEWKSERYSALARSYSRENDVKSSTAPKSSDAIVTVSAVLRSLPVLIL